MTREATGLVPEDSLAAESLSSGGAFTSNKPSSSSSSSNPPEEGFNPASTLPHETPSQHKSHNAHNNSEQGGPAPSYVNVPSALSSGGKPHGKNITQDDDMTGRPGKFNVEVGSAEDPSREALRDMRLKQTRGAPGTGEREVGVRGAKEGEQPYAALGGETSA